ncbi:MAG: thiol:disulfide interchange protein DsbA/DsbL [Alphaproteobacteria bacterium]|nr:thiol:disulfide interchange protein DsbA/DsbL [Alphaproteobacteria bacterium]
MINRRQASLAVAVTVAWGQSALAQPFHEGIEFATLDQPVTTEAGPGKIEVIEFFWYSCPHCNAFEPAFKQWIERQPKDVFVKRVPVRFRDDFEPQQRMFYVLEALGKLEPLHGRLFQAIHVERQSLSGADQLGQWALKQGISKADFDQAYNSFGVVSKARRATQLQQAFKVQGVPSLGIAGRYYTDLSMASGMARALQIVETLIVQERGRKK